MALGRGVDPAEWSRRLHVAYDGFLQTGAEPAGVRPIVTDSWRRSLTSGIDPDGADPPVELTDDELDDYRAAHPLAAAMPVISSLLVDDARADGFLVAVTDAAGRILWLDGESRLRSRAAGMHFVEGAVWSEAAAGTNAPGTALALDHPVQVFTAEHFRRTVQPWSCAAAPVHDPVTGVLLGAIDVTGGDDIAAPQVLTLVRAAASAVESELALQAARLEPARPAGSWSSATGTGSSRAGLRRGHVELSVIGRASAVLRGRGPDVTLSARHSELLLLLAEHPEGRSAEQLATDLHEYAVPLVTIRAELSRLRHLLDRVLGPGSLRSRPYRLHPPLDTDLSALRRLLARGAHRQALDLHVGPVLPSSSAPGIEAVRHETEQLMRETMLAGASPVLLLEYAAAGGRYDAALWRACRDLLPADAPQQPAVGSHLAWIDEQLAANRRPDPAREPAQKNSSSSR